MAQRAIEMPYYVSLMSGFRTRTGIQFCLRGSDGEGDNDTEEENDDDDETGSEGQDGADATTDDSKAEIESLKRRMQAADKNASALQKKLKEYEDRDKDETTKATERVAELESTVQEQTTTIGQLRLHNAFLISNTYSWDDPEYALDFAERKGYLEDVTDEEGNVDQPALRKALDKLAKDKPRMIKASGKDEDEENPPATDQGVGSKRKNGKAEKDATVLAQRFPAAFRN